jgi:hypothetical protein
MPNRLGYDTVNRRSTYSTSEEITRNMQEMIVSHTDRMGEVKEGQNEVTCQQTE